ncbi:hypothetical protein GCM10010512_34040 [Streptomyces thermoviolaceus subsp. thermoviolaceus]|nr:hypothetical protein GCM10010499_08530 [Streptomyces thermoviolaceus subsp. apingens]GHA99774.1 hypothetical protein GCM10010512_34040 [Streptomyces thermoviolaceus subsp. thermoviolaceus]
MRGDRAATGLGRNSVHDTFKGTRDPFERAPARYIDTMTAARLAVLEDVRLSGAERIRALLAMISSTARPNTARAAAAPVSDREHHGRTRRPRPAGGADA